MSRSVIWILLICTGIVGVILTIILTDGGIAVATGIAALAVWIGFGTYTSWRFGLRRQIAAHLGPHWRIAEVLRHRLRTAERVNLQLALDWLQSQAGTPGPFGIHHVTDLEDELDANFAPADLIGLIDGNPEPTGISWEPMPTSPDERLHCASNAIYLLRVDGQPIVVLVQGRSTQSSKRAIVQVMGRTQEAARAALDELLRLSREQSVYRGQVISLVRPRGQSNDLSVQIHELERVDREAIVLPASVVEVIDRNILSFFRHAETLRRAGQGTRHGVLLHGPPGTGKTLVTRYLASHVGGTVLLVNGRQYAQFRATCQLARLLSPSLVILEDVDLIASDRRRNAHAPLLHEMLDEMDGLGSSGAEVVFLLTTNRPEVLEPALAGRPGRVDQAVYFPLPDLECRRRLFAQLSSALELSGVDVEPLLLRTEGASPAFLKELFRRATLMAIERGKVGERIRLTGDDFAQALRELVETGGSLTRNFLGFPARPPGS